MACMSTQQCHLRAVGYKTYGSVYRALCRQKIMRMNCNKKHSQWCVMNNFYCWRYFKMFRVSKLLWHLATTFRRQIIRENHTFIDHFYLLNEENIIHSVSEELYSSGASILPQAYEAFHFLLPTFPPLPSPPLPSQKHHILFYVCVVWIKCSIWGLLG